MSTFYKVRKVGTDLYYTPPGAGDNACELQFTGEGKHFPSLKDARAVQEFCAEWLPGKSIPCEVVHYIEDVLEIGVVQRNGKTKFALNQQPTTQMV